MPANDTPGAAEIEAAIDAAMPASDGLCSDCPPAGYPTDATRCLPCPRRDPTPSAAEIDAAVKRATQIVREEMPPRTPPLYVSGDLALELSWVLVHFHATIATLTAERDESIGNCQHAIHQVEIMRMALKEEIPAVLEEVIAENAENRRRAKAAEATARQRLFEIQEQLERAEKAEAALKETEDAWAAQVIGLDEAMAEVEKRAEAARLESGERLIEIQRLHDIAAAYETSAKALAARVAELEARIQRVVDHIDIAAGGEMYTNDADLIANVRTILAPSDGGGDVQS